jgi:ribonuclease BN (tRNA processing enzyme)
MKLSVIGKYGPYPIQGGGTSCYLVKAAGKRILLDCGAGAVSHLGEKAAGLDCVVLSHLHPDHICDLLLLDQAIRMQAPDRKVDLYLPLVPGPMHELIQSLEGFSILAVEGECSFEREGVSLRFLPLTHPVPSYGVALQAEGRTLAYTGDTSEDPRIVRLLAGADAALMDAAFTRDTLPAMPAHLCAERCGQYAREAGVAKLLLTHIHPLAKEAEVEAEASEAFSGAMVVKEGACYTI